MTGILEPTTEAEQSGAQVPAQWSLPRIMLHLEGAAVFIAVVVIYASIRANGWLFVLLFLVPDLTFAAYLLNTAFGARVYNIMHTYTLPLVLAVGSLLAGWTLGLWLALIWLGHIGADRALGYGLKYVNAFKSTHMGGV